MDAEDLDLLAGTYQPSTRDSVADQVAAYESSNGQIANTVEGRPIVILTTRAAESDCLHKLPLLRIEFQGTYYGVVAFTDGPFDDAVWYRDIAVYPTVHIQDGAMTHTMRAREFSPVERLQWWSLGGWPHIPRFETPTKRDFRVVIFRPAHI